MSDKDSLLEAMEQIIQKAELEKKWLRGSYNGATMTPAELRAANAEGRYIWPHFSNWEYVDPTDVLLEEGKKCMQAATDFRALKRKYYAWKSGEEKQDAC